MSIIDPSNAPSGPHVIRVDWATGQAYSVQSIRVVANTVKGQKYTATGYAAAITNSAKGKKVELVIRERDGNDKNTAFEASSDITLTSDYQLMTVPTLTAAQSGDRIDVYVIQFDAVAGDAFGAAGLRLYME